MLLQQTSPEMGTLLKKVDHSKGELDEYQSAVLREATRSAQIMSHALLGPCSAAFSNIPKPKLQQSARQKFSRVREAIDAPKQVPIPGTGSTARALPSQSI